MHAELAQATNAAVPLAGPGAASRAISSAIAGEIVLLAFGGEQGDLEARLSASDRRSASRAIEELCAFYLFIAQRSVPAFVPKGRSADELLTMLWEDTWGHIATVSGTGTFEQRATFAELWYRRKHQYGNCDRLFRREGEALEGTAILEFYDNLLPLGDEIRTEVMASLQVETLYEAITSAMAEGSPPLSS